MFNYEARMMLENAVLQYSFIEDVEYFARNPEFPFLVYYQNEIDRYNRMINRIIAGLNPKIQRDVVRRIRPAVRAIRNAERRGCDMDRVYFRMGLYLATGE